MNRKTLFFRAALLAGVAAAWPAPPVAARTWTFDPGQLSGAGQDADISVFNQAGQLPGAYITDILLNGRHVDTQEMVFHPATAEDGSPVLKTCLTRAALAGYGVKINDFPGLFPDGHGTEGDCAHLAVIPGAREEFQFSNQQLLLSVPQIALEPDVRGIAPQTLWDDGMPAILMNYQMNATRTETRGAGRQVSDSRFVRLDPGINLGAWRLRSTGTYRQTSREAGQWQTGDTRLERGLYGLKSRLTLGEHYTPSDIFGSVPFRGVMLSSDEAMLPAGMREATPVVRGIARTQARVDIRQGGSVIYSTTVAPGPFALTDVPAGSNGDLQVTVVETDGPPQVFTVPWTMPAIALPEGRLEYSLMAGQYHPDERGVTTAPLAQATVMYGLSRGLTAYGGLQGAAHYQGGSLGLGVLLGAAGALSVDVTQGRGQLPGGETRQGQAWRLRYSKRLDSTGTGVSLSTTRYSPEGAVSPGGILGQWRDDGRVPAHLRDRHDRQREALTTLGLGQSLGGLGALNLNVSRESYRNGSARKAITASFSSVTRGVSWSVNWTQRTTPPYRDGARSLHEQEASLWVNIPLDRWFSGASASYQMLSGPDGQVRHEAGLSGDAFARQLRWNVRQQYRPGEAADNRNNGLLNLTWNGAYGVLDGGYSYSGTSRQVNAGLSGGVVVHEHGVTAGQPLYSTTALVAAPGIAGVSAGGQAGVKTDFRGYTTLSGLSPYQVNTVELDPSTLPADAELPRTGIKVVPTDGAVIPVRFPTRTGARAVVTLHRPDGRPVPFGSVVTLAGDTRQGAGITGGDGEVYMSGLPAAGELEVHTGTDGVCRAAYRLPEKAGPAGVYALHGVCR